MAFSSLYTLKPQTCLKRLVNIQALGRHAQEDILRIIFRQTIHKACLVLAFSAFWILDEFLIIGLNKCLNLGQISAKR